MTNRAAQQIIARFLAVGSAAITIFIMTGGVTDPVNATKFLILGVVSTGILGVILKFEIGDLLKTNKVALGSVSLFGMFVFISAALSTLPLTQNIYGLYGRNSGFLTYMFLIIAAVGSLSIRENSNFQKVIYGLAVAGIVNVIYSIWVLSFGDFVGWVNPYGNILGTLGNPNFIGAFLGMFFAVQAAYFFNKNLNSKIRILILLTAVVTFYEIYKSHAIQGRVVAVSGLAIVGFFYTRSNYSRFFVWVYSASITLMGALAGLGALQIGPLTKYIYKYSVSLRGQYWLAGWNTGESHPMHGVGMDGLGDWYRRSRDIHALTVPGVNTVVNAAHNVFMDMFAFGGWPLFVTYVSVMALGAISLIRYAKRENGYDPIFTSLAVAWIGYQLQSLISINQIGLAIWGWVLTGALIAYERNSRISEVNDRLDTQKSLRKSTNKPVASIVNPGLVAGICMVIGGVIASPPLASDMKWRSAQLAQSVPLLEAALSPSFMNPQHSTRYLVSIQAFEGSNMPELAHKYALAAVKFNPDNFELWKVLYLIQASTPEEKAKALRNMKRLDPLNPDVTAR